MWGTFHIILLVPHNIVMDMNNVMKWADWQEWLCANDHLPNGTCGAPTPDLCIHVREPPI